EQEQARTRGEGACNLEALAVGQGERGGGQVALRPQAELLEDRGGKISRTGSRFFPEEGADHHVIQNGEAGERLDDLEGAANAGGADLVCSQPMYVLLIKNNVTGIGSEDARHHVEDRRLAG